MRPWTTTLEFTESPADATPVPPARASPPHGATAIPAVKEPRDPTATPFPSPRLPLATAPAGAVPPPWLPQQHRAICCLQPLSRVVGAPKAAHAYKLYYRTPDHRGQLAEGTGLLYLPAGTAPAGGWPVVLGAWHAGHRRSLCAFGLRPVPACARRALPRSVPGAGLVPWSRRITRGWAVQAAMPIRIARTAARNAIDMIKASRQYLGRTLSPRWPRSAIRRAVPPRSRRATSPPPMVGRRCSTAAAYHRNAHRSRTDRAGDEARQPHRQSGRAQRVSRVSARWPAAGRAADRPRPQR